MGNPDDPAEALAKGLPSSPRTAWGTYGTDVAIVVVGERTGWVGPVTAGEQVDRQDLRLPGDQDALVEAVAAMGVPTAVVVASGRPLLLDRVSRCANAVLWAPLLGPAAGLAVADVLEKNRPRRAASGHLPRVSRPGPDLPRQPGRQRIRQARRRRRTHVHRRSVPSVVPLRTRPDVHRIRVRRRGGRCRRSSGG
ncbi:glycoside hydrolase family 3 protein [Streptodolium elevatio]